MGTSISSRVPRGRTSLLSRVSDYRTRAHQSLKVFPMPLCFTDREVTAQRRKDTGGHLERQVMHRAGNRT